MQGISTNKPGGLATDGVAALRINAAQTQSQINAQTRTVAQRVGQNKTTLRNGDFGATFGTDYVTLTQGASKGTAFSIRFPRALAQYVALQADTGAPSVDDNFPNEGDYGWYVDTSGPTYYWVVNYGGALVSPTISTLPGTITSAQHADQSAAVGTFHGFAQISGTITSAQHGSQTVGTLHAVASGATAGFMSTAHYTLVNGATTSATADTLVLRNASAIINSAGYNTSGTQVIGARATGWGVPTGTLARSTYGTYTAVDFSTHATYAAAQADLTAMSAAVQQVSRRLGALITDLFPPGTGNHGLIGT